MACPQRSLTVPVLVALATLLGTAVRLYQVGESLWVDELHTAWVISDRLVDLPHRAAMGNTSPLYFYLPWAATRLFGVGEFAVRLPSLAAGIALAAWFKGEARRVYAILGESDEDRERRRLVEWLERRGGSVTPRDVQMGCRWLREPGAAEAAVETLARAGWGCWEPTPPGRRGQPTRHFRLSTPSTVNSIRALPGENSNTVDVDTVDAPDSQADGEWGEV